MDGKLWQEVDEEKEEEPYIYAQVSNSHSFYASNGNMIKICNKNQSKNVLNLCQDLECQRNTAQRKQIQMQY